jgi:hypothetical protein
MSRTDINRAFELFQVQLPILTTLPELVPPGAEFYYQGTKWRGLGAGETAAPEGTPWPVKGYKEYVALLNFPVSGEAPVASVVYNDTGTTPNDWTRTNVGIYTTQINFSLGITFSLSAFITQSGVRPVNASSAFIEFKQSGSQVTIRSRKVSGEPPEQDLQIGSSASDITINFIYRIYPKPS